MNETVAKSYPHYKGGYEILAFPTATPSPPKPLKPPLGLWRFRGLGFAGGQNKSGASFFLIPKTEGTHLQNPRD